VNEEFGLGMSEEYNQYKIYYFLFIISVITFLAWSAIGVGYDIAKTRMVNYYLWLCLISVAFILFDNLTKKEFGEIDTVTIEKTPIHPKFLVLIGFVISIFMVFRIQSTKTAFVPYPQFQLFDYRLPNALLSGVAGIVEDMFFFAFLLPTIFAVLNRRVFQNFVISAFFSILATALLFMLFHIFVYGLANQPAFFASFVFGLISSSLVILTRSIILSHFLHFTNNFVASLLMVMAIVWW